MVGGQSPEAGTVAQAGSGELASVMANVKQGANQKCREARNPAPLAYFLQQSTS